MARKPRVTKVKIIPSGKGPYGAGSRPARVRKPSQVGGSTQGQQGCCPMVAAVRSVRRGKFRLARRYARMSVRLVMARVA